MWSKSVELLSEDCRKGKQEVARTAQSLFRALCRSFPALPTPASLAKARRPVPHSSSMGTLLWVEQAHLTPTPKNQPPKRLQRGLL